MSIVRLKSIHANPILVKIIALVQILSMTTNAHVKRDTVEKIVLISLTIAYKDPVTTMVPALTKLRIIRVCVLKATMEETVKKR